MAKAKKETAKKVVAPKSTKATAKDYSVILKPVFTEKATMIGSGDKTAVAFKVARTACKCDIKQAVERIFSVQVESVRTANYAGKIKTMGKSSGRRSNYKKAYITLKPGNTIDLVEGL